MKVLWVNGLGEDTESELFGTFHDAEGAVRVIVRNWRNGEYVALLQDECDILL